GFEVKEPLVLVRGKPRSKSAGRGQAKPLAIEDLHACADLCHKIHGFDRVNELRDAVNSPMCRPMGLIRNGRVVAYVSAPTCWFLNHAVGETLEDMTELLTAAGEANADPLFFLLPTRQAAFFRWVLAEGMRVVKPMSLMAMGQYQEPRGI